MQDVQDFVKCLSEIWNMQYGRNVENVELHMLDLKGISLNWMLEYTVRLFEIYILHYTSRLYLNFWFLSEKDEAENVVEVNWKDSRFQTPNYELIVGLWNFLIGASRKLQRESFSQRHLVQTLYNFKLDLGSDSELYFNTWRWFL